MPSRGCADRDHWHPAQRRSACPEAQDALNRLGDRDIRHGTLDITLYRDDLASIGSQAQLRRTDIDFNIDGVYVILVDGRPLHRPVGPIRHGCLGRSRPAQGHSCSRSGGSAGAGKLPIQPDFRRCSRLT